MLNKKFLALLLSLICLVSFIGAETIEVAENATYRVFTDINCKEIDSIPSYTVNNLNIGNNTYYFLVSNGIQEIRENGFGRDNIPRMMAAVVVISVPLIILFIIFRKKIMEGVARGGTKG